MNVNLTGLTTEQRNERSRNIDQLSTHEIINLMNKEDSSVAEAIQEVLPQIEAAIEVIYHTLKNNGRLFYVGAGTSGRLGVLDAAECPPTFCTPPELVQAIIAGGESAMFTAVEGAEDYPEEGAKDLENRGFNKNDVVVGIAASGRTPYVIGALQYARKIGSATVSLACNQNAEISKYADHQIEVVVGPEILSGSTRLKAATAQKMILNMLSTTTMIKLGKIYDNLMVDLNASNLKLVERAKQIVMEITGASYEQAEKSLKETNQKVKPAIVMLMGGVPVEKANEVIELANGFTRKAIELAKEGQQP
ncbi:N-acetylmuramic acid-6-phosphate etherase [Bacillus sp. FJAT-18017]|uniref:N-acetylmuramic acid 6-phosphate etherase n=1 Tax=Bacillus sp. FJAT-18017 TaxID=1705566 RepID=UPI0006AEE90F|nr:N-acetylmuramic acid 6-phosphate etherase [Bacillus sp. FJAT-18017]ALC91435.1 N-acetylmuramic acid-6-phosphate etherase [Bacillus sp. FJAT-18017]